MRRRVTALAVFACITTTVAGCGFNINSIPIPGQGHNSGYPIIAEFANVLNLPDRAKVVMDGTTVGVVSDVAVAGDHVDVTAEIDTGVDVPSNGVAVLQQATVLGDIYVAIDRPQLGVAAAPPLGPGGRIPLSNTTSPPQLEDTIANLANFIGSGSIQRAQNTVIRLNSITPPRPQLRQIVTRVTTDLRGLSDNIETVDTLLTGVEQMSTVLARRAPQLAVWFSERGVGGFRRNMVLADTFGRLLPSLGSIYNGGYWLVPLIRSLGASIGAFGQDKRTVEAEYPLYRRFIEDYFMRQDKYPAVNITSIVGLDGRELSGNVEQVLRMLGAVP